VAVATAPQNEGLENYGFEQLRQPDRHSLTYKGEDVISNRDLARWNYSAVWVGEVAIVYSIVNEALVTLRLTLGEC
jgi:hypothetical protein